MNTCRVDLSNTPAAGRVDPLPSPASTWRKAVLSYAHPGGCLMRQDGRPDTLGASLINTRRSIMNMIIYIVGLVVVIGFLLSFFGLR